MITHALTYVLPAAFSLLPSSMASDPARAMLLAIGLQESRFQMRRQVRGPARGFWQFERGGGVTGVLTHPSTRPHLLHALDVLRYEPNHIDLHEAIEHNDTLACVFARLLLWTVPKALPSPDEPEAGWQQYLEGWRPGKPHRQTWDAFYREAWQRVRLEMVTP